MFTAQSGQIENALRLGGASDISAKEMVQGMANCQQILRHRAPVSIQPPGPVNIFPTIRPAGTSIRFPDINLKNVLVNIPPWSQIPFVPLPYPDPPIWQPIPYPDWPDPFPQWPADSAGGDGGDTVISGDTLISQPTFTTSGPTYMGDVNSSTVNTQVVNTSVINNAGPVNSSSYATTNNNTFVDQTTQNRYAGDIINAGNIYNTNNTFLGGDTFHGGDTVHQGDTINQGNTFNDRRVTNRHESFSETHHHYDAHFHAGSTFYEETRFDGPTYIGGNTYVGGPITTSGPNIFYGDTTHNGDTFFGGDVYVTNPDDPSGPPLGPLRGLVINLVTDVEWDGTSLSKTYRQITIIAAAGADQEEEIVSGTSCPSTPLNASAGNLVDMP
jgi:hypothetical protein